jgi:hypothetical protein
VTAVLETAPGEYRYILTASGNERQWVKQDDIEAVDNTEDD